MRYNEILANRVREKLISFDDVEEKEMFSGLVFMVNGKMCVGVMKENLMLRINPNKIEEVVELNGCSQMMMKSRLMKGYVLVDETAVQSATALNFWVNLALEFNPLAKASRKK